MIDHELAIGRPRWMSRSGTPHANPYAAVSSADHVSPSGFVQGVFWLSAFAIPFSSLYIPGTGEHLGVVRVVQGLVFLAMLCQPAVCIRRWPIALSWFFGYCFLRLLWGCWMTPQLASVWWPDTSRLIQFQLPWVLFLFNLLQFRVLARRGLWAFALGTSFCATLHLAGIGVQELDHGMEGRTSVLGENANVVGANYAAALLVVLGLLLATGSLFRQRVLLLSLIPLNTLGMAMTGSRTASLILGLGFVILLVSSYAAGHRVRAILVLVLTAAILGTVLCTVPTVLRRFDTFRSHDPRAEPRARMLPVLWEMYKRNPVLGAGPEDYQYELTRRAMPYMLKKKMTISAHNLLLLLLVETGIVGLVVFGKGFAMTLISAWKARKHSATSLPLALLIPMTVAGLTSSDPHYHSVFWFAVAYGLAGRDT